MDHGDERCSLGKTAKTVYEMIRALTGRGILLAVLNLTARPFAGKLANSQSPKLSRAFTATILRRAPSGFSVSFAPEPDEPETSRSTKLPADEAKLRKSPRRKATTKGKPANKPKSKKKSAQEAEGGKPQPEQENSTVRGTTSTAQHASSIAIPDNSAIGPQTRATPSSTQQTEDKATQERSGADSAYEKPVRQELDDDVFVAGGREKQPVDSDDHRSAASGGVQPAAERGKERSEPRSKRDSTTVVGSRFVLDKATSKPGALVELSQSLAEQEQGSEGRLSSWTESTSPSSVRKVHPTIPKTNLQTTPPRTSFAKKEPWQAQKQALEKKFGSEGWNPRKKLSPDTIDGIRALHEQFPNKYSTPVLAEKFKVSPEAIRRILKSKWRPDPEKQAERRERWARRHDRIWDQQAAIGLRPARTKDRVPKEPGDLEEDADVGELQLARSQKRARDMHHTDDA